MDCVLVHYDSGSRSVRRGEGVSFESALVSLLSGSSQSFLCLNGEIAKALCMGFEDRIYEIDKGKEWSYGYYWHYHINSRHGNPHVWHYGDRLTEW